LNQAVKEPELWEIRQGELHLNLNEAQACVHNSLKRFILLLIGSQGGKTSYAPFWLFHEIQKTCKSNELNDYLVVTSTYKLLSLKLLPVFRECFEQILVINGEPVGKYIKSEQTITFNYGGAKGRIIFCSAENPESMESATAKAAVLDECGQVQFKREAWEACRRRMTLHRGRILLMTTLYAGGGWLKADLYDHWEKQDEQGQDIDVFQFDSTVNPKFTKEEFESLRLTMPAWKFNMQHRGRFDTPVGLVYDSFNTDNCMIGRHKSPVQLDWPVYCGMDFGNDTAAMFYRVDPNTGFYYAEAEYLAAGRTTAEHVEYLSKIHPRKDVLKCCGGKGDPGDDAWREAFTNAGWAVSMPSVRAVEVGISRVYAFHKLNKLFVFSDLYDYLKEKESYSYKLDDNQESLGEISGKQRYHLMDAERYILGEFNLSATSGNKIKMWSW